MEFWMVEMFNEDEYMCYEALRIDDIWIGWCDIVGYEVINWTRDPRKMCDHNWRITKIGDI